MVNTRSMRAAHKFDYFSQAIHFRLNKCIIIIQESTYQITQPISSIKSFSYPIGNWSDENIFSMAFP